MAPASVTRRMQIRDGAGVDGHPGYEDAELHVEVSEADLSTLTWAIAHQRAVSHQAKDTGSVPATFTFPCARAPVGLPTGALVCPGSDPDGAAICGRCGQDS